MRLRRLLPLFCSLVPAVGLTLSAGPARGDDAMSVALEADAVNQEYCADVYNKKVSRQGRGLA